MRVMGLGALPLVNLSPHPEEAAINARLRRAMAAVSKDEGPGTPWFETPRLRAAPHHEVTNIGEHTMS
jgi:hypothetical protein